jgi:hypothetical protein
MLKFISFVMLCFMGIRKSEHKLQGRITIVYLSFRLYVSILLGRLHQQHKNKQTPWPLVNERTIPTELNNITN